jgi:aminomuconate-semialdehyde/2-hydroxymuconate-6-semialdehyde dehydrogenase
VLNYLGGDFQPAVSGRWLDNFNPALGEVSGRVSASDAADVAAAVTAAQAAWPGWSGNTPAERARHLLRLADLLERDQDSLAMDEANDSGKPLCLARVVDLPRSVANFRFFAGAIQGFGSESHAMPNAINFTLRRPVGIVGCISPWNLPLYLLTWKIAPALAAGNCVVAKPSELTPLTAYRLAQRCREAGLPPGVLSILHGRGPEVGQAMVIHPALRVISFTGGTATGRQILASAAPHFKRCSLELGGKNPNLIFHDCDYQLALETTLRSSFSNQGQICLCGSRILIEDALYEKFRDDFVERARKLIVGDPLDGATDLGAVISAAHRDKILNYIELARQEGGRVLCGGQALQPTGRCRNGWFVTPTIIEGLGPACRTNQEEIFGPVVTLQRFVDARHALELANATCYGLSASIWTGHLARALHLAEQIEAGVVWVNCWLVRDLRTPFGGTKQSGLGREGGEEALRFFTEPKNVCVAYESSGGGD